MHRPWQIWTSFAACLLLLVAAVGWLSVKALESDEAEAAARRQAALEENARLALWRMDTLLAPVIAQEGAIPFAEYVTYHTSFDDSAPPVKTPVKGKAETQPPAASVVPSALLTARDPNVLLHFQLSDRLPSKGADSATEGLFDVTSPEVPCGPMVNLVVPHWISSDQLRLNETRLSELASHFASVPRGELVAQLPAVAATGATLLANRARIEFPSVVPQGELANDLFEPGQLPQQAANPPADAAPPQIAGPPQMAAPQQTAAPQIAGQSQIAATRQPTSRVPFNDAQNAAQQPNSQAADQALRNRTEYEARQRFVASTNTANIQYQGNSVFNGVAPSRDEQQMAPQPLSNVVTTSVMKPLWIGKDLVLVRAVSRDAPVFAQGALLDWPLLKKRLLSEVGDLLPNADLMPASVRLGDALNDVASEPDTRLLASLPVRLVTGDLSPSTTVGWSPVRSSLLIAWLAIALASAAVAIMLRGVLTLSERRAAFVSAVTHELRTPLTTFRMYAEMLSENMVPDESARRGYLQTLRVEAERLTHLVANVLAYARLERGALTGRIERIRVDRLLDEATHRLSERAAQAGFTMEVNADESVRASEALADASAVEQILFNLVDNACKYAAEAQDKTLCLTVHRTRQRASQIEIRLVDRGPGVAPAAQRRLFQAFRKSAQDAAHSAPGVGLGLALSRRLARELAGDLRYEPTAGGACFVLLLRAAE